MKLAACILAFCVGFAPVAAYKSSGGPLPTMADPQPCDCASGGVCLCDDCQCVKPVKPLKSVCGGCEGLPAIDAAVVFDRLTLPRSVESRGEWLAQVAPPEPKAPFVVNIAGPTRVKVGELGLFTVGESTATRFAWLCIPPSVNFHVDTSNRQAYFTERSGTFTIVLVGIDGDNLALDSHPVTIGDAPPEPGPGPTPPTPVPPGPSGLRVLILKEAAENYDRQTLATLHSTAIKSYLHPRVAKAADGKTPEFRTWDDDYSADQMAFVQEHWRKLYEQAKKDAAGKLPWIIIQDGAKGESRALPKTEAETLDLLKKYGGP